MVTMVVIKCPETDREIPTGIVTDLARFRGSLAMPSCSALTASRNIVGQ